MGFPRPSPGIALFSEDPWFPLQADLGDVVGLAPDAAVKRVKVVNFALVEALAFHL